MELRSSIIPLLFLAHQVSGQVDFPVSDIQNVTWDQGIHHVRRYEGIVSPGFGGDPVSIQGSADVEMVSADQVRLTPGFHAAPATEGARFRAYIDPLIEPPGDLVIISPNPTTHIIDDVLLVEKWEKLEVGLRLPAEHVAAINAFFDKYYSNGVDQAATPEQVIPEYELNPYADDSLQLVMTLTSPSGVQRMKWGFFMREATWSAANDVNAVLVENTASPFTPYSVRFRFSPDEEGLWLFNVAIRTPYTTMPEDVPLPPLDYTGYSFNCVGPRDDNKGPLKVNEDNGRYLQYKGSLEPFLALGVNMADTRRQEYSYTSSGTDWTLFYQQDFDKMMQSMEDLHGSGGNFLRLFLMRHIFAPEWVNLGVYDAFRVPEVCDQNDPTPCDNTGWITNKVGNGQFQSWAFDQMLDQARDNSIYLQLCIDPYPPIIAYEKFLWGAHPFAINFLEPNRQTTGNPFDMKDFFYSNGDPEAEENKVLYFWKRKYKYIMSRWGYSVHLPIIEPFNEIDQMLSYKDADLTPPPIPCDSLDEEPYWDMCMENRVDWERDPDLPAVFSEWLTDIAQYVRGEVDESDPVSSPLGESDKLFLVSYTGAFSPENAPPETYIPPAPPDHFLPFENDEVDLMDVHLGFYPNVAQEMNLVDRRMKEGFDHARLFLDEYAPEVLEPELRKPFNQGEFNHYTFVENKEIEKLFHNYDVSFHNELWSSVFSQKFAVGSTWHWERVFWWADALPVPEFEDDNPIVAANNLGEFSNAVGASNGLDVGGIPTFVENKTLHHNFRPLADFVQHPGVQGYGFFSSESTAHFLYDDEGTVDPVAYYYLMAPSNDAAIGWVHNRNASVLKSFYLNSVTQNFLGCAAPTAQSHELQGFESGQDYYITFFPTRVEQVDLPISQQHFSVGGEVGISLISEPLGGTLNGYLDTLHADYAFIITPEPFTKSAKYERAFDENPVTTVSDFTLYPNPTRGELFVRLDHEAPVDVSLFDLSGRPLYQWYNLNGPVINLPITQLAQGTYFVQVDGGGTLKAKKLIIY